MKKTLLQKGPRHKLCGEERKKTNSFRSKIFQLSTINTAENFILSTGDALPEMESGEEVNVEEAQQRSLQ